MALEAVLRICIARAVVLEGRRIVSIAVLLALGLAGYAVAPGWLVPAGAAVLTLDGWRPWRPGRATRIDWTSKAITYLVTGLIADLGLAALAFLGGRFLRLLLAA